MLNGEPANRPATVDEFLTGRRVFSFRELADRVVGLADEPFPGDGRGDDGEAFLAADDLPAECLPGAVAGDRPGRGLGDLTVAVAGGPLRVDEQNVRQAVAVQAA